MLLYQVCLESTGMRTSTAVEVNAQNFTYSVVRLCLCVPDLDLVVRVPMCVLFTLNRTYVKKILVIIYG